MHGLRVQSLPRVTVLSPGASLMGGAETNELDAAFRTAMGTQPAGIVLNLTDVPAMNSVGVGLLAGFAAAVRASGTKLAVCCVARRVQPIFKLVALPEWRLFETEADAVRWCSGAEA